MLNQGEIPTSAAYVKVYPKTNTVEVEGYSMTLSIGRQPDDETNIKNILLTVPK